MKAKPYVLSIDPGLSSGIAFIRREPLKLVHSDELPPNETGDFVSALLREYPPDHVDVVMERFLITQATAKNSQQGVSLEVIGVVKYLCHAYGADPVTLQTPADAKSFSSNARLKQLELWHVGGEGHALDALRHAVLRLTRTGWTDPRLLLR